MLMGGGAEASGALRPALSARHNLGLFAPKHGPHLPLLSLSLNAHFQGTIIPPSLPPPPGPGAGARLKSASPKCRL